MQNVKNKFVWSIGFIVFRVHEYRFHAYIWKMLFLSRFLLYAQLKVIMLYDRINFMLQTIANIFRQIKIKIFRLCCYYEFVVSNVHPHYYNNLIRLLLSFLVILLCWYKKCTICLISFFSLYELFVAFCCANNTVNIWLIVYLQLRFLIFPFFYFSLMTF